MDLVHPNAIPYAGESMDLFQPPLLQTQIVREYDEICSPSTEINKASGGQLGQIEILVHKSSAYIDLSMVRLLAEIQILNKKGEPIKDTDKIGPVNNMVDSAFSDVSLQFNGKSLVLNRHDYPYLAYVNNLFNLGKGMKDEMMWAYGWVEDAKGKFDSLIQSNSGALSCENISLLTRRNLIINAGGELESLSYLYTPLSNQVKYLVDGVDLKFTFTRNADAFMLMGDDDGYRFMITKMKLLVRKIVPTFEVIDAHRHVMSKNSSASYFCKPMILKTVNLSAGVSGCIHEFVESRLPVHCLVSFVSEAAYMGSLKHNPYKFNHYDISFLAFYHNGISYPNEPYQLDVGRKKYLRAYDAFMSYIGSGIRDDRFVGISPEDYITNTFFLPCDFAACDDKNNVFVVPKSGNLRCEMRFSKPLDHSVTALFFFTFEACTFIDKDKNILFNAPV